MAIDKVTSAGLTEDIITGQTAETSIATDDLILLSDTSASGALKKMTRANFVSGVGESNTPSFYAFGDGATSITNATLVRVAVQNEQVDNGGCYNNTSGSVTLNSLTAPAYSFTPNVAGLYYFTGAVQLNTTNFNVGLVNNLGSVGGSETYASLVYRKSDTANGMVMVAGYSNMNGTGNNVSLTGYQESGGSINTNDSFYTTYFGGFLVKAS